MSELPAPAIKVAGRRLSTSSKPKSHPKENHAPPPPPDPEPSTPTDYPRPAPPADLAARAASEQDKHKGQVHWLADTGARPKERLHEESKAPKEPEIPRAAKDAVGNHGRISQPSGKAINL